MLIKKVKGISWTHEGSVGNCPYCGRFITARECNNTCKHCQEKIRWNTQVACGICRNCINIDIENNTGTCECDEDNLITVNLDDSCFGFMWNHKEN